MNGPGTSPPAGAGKRLSGRLPNPESALGAALLAVLLTSCSTTVTRYVPAPVTPIPASLTAPCPPSPPPDNPLTYGAAMEWDELLLTDLQNCNAQLSAIRRIETERRK